MNVSLSPRGAPRVTIGRRRSSVRAFTLIEVLIAVLVLTTGLMTGFYMVAMGTAVDLDGKITTQAYMAAAQEVEILRNMPYSRLQSITRTTTNPESRFLKPDGTDDASRPGDTNYNSNLVPALRNLPGRGTGGLIITNDSTAGNLCKRVTVVVRWTDKGNQPRLVTVNTNIASGGINLR
jgi:hypothetical protein